MGKRKSWRRCPVGLLLLLSAWSADADLAEGPAFDASPSNALMTLTEQLRPAYGLIREHAAHLQFEEAHGRLLLRDRRIELTFGGANDNLGLLQVADRKTGRVYLNQPSPYQAIQWVPGVQGTGARFNGTNSSVSLADHPTLAALADGPFAVDLHIRVNELPDRGDVGILSGEAFGLFINAQGQLYAYLRTEEQPWHIAMPGGLRVQTGQWQRVVFAYDGARRIDWMLAGKKHVDEASTRGRLKMNHSGLVVGRHRANYFRGMLDELWIGPRRGAPADQDAMPAPGDAWVYLPFDERVPAVLPAVAEPLWRLQVSGPNGERATVDAGADAVCSNHLHRQTVTTYPATDPVRQWFWRYSLNLIWDQVRVPWSTNSLKVTVTCTLWNGYDGEARWNIAVDNSSGDVAVETIEFPRLPLRCSERDPEKDIFTTNFGWGQLHPDPLRSATLDSWSRPAYRYPSSVQPLQFNAFYRADETGGGLYLAAHDGAGYAKHFQHRPNRGKHQLDYAMSFDVPDGVKPGRDAALPYDFVMAVFDGDWYDAAQRYREWATRQIWCSKGPLSARHDMPGWFIEHAGGFNLWLRPQVAPAVIGPLAEALTARPFLFLWYNWGVPIAHKDTPYAPYAVGLEKDIQTLHNMGCRVIPYFDVHLWDMGVPDWPAHRPYAVMTRDGRTAVEAYPMWEQDFAIMCPACRPFHKRTAEVVQSIQHAGFDGVYMDQITASPPTPCYHPEHNHPLGGGSHWVDGYRDLLKEIRYRTDTNDRYFVLTSEASPECWMDLLDGNLIHSPVLCNSVPIFAAVYGDYTVRYGSAFPVGRDGKKAFVMAYGQHVLFGGAPSFLSNSKIYRILDPENADMLAFVNQMGQLRLKGLSYLAYGRMLRPLRYVNPVPDVVYQRSVPRQEIDPDVPQPDIQERMPAVINTVWRSPEGRIGVVLLNIGEAPQTVVLDLGQVADGAVSRTDKVTLLTATTTRRLKPREGKLSVTLEPRTGGILELQPVE